MIAIKGVDMPKCCDDCWALDDNGDYPFCLITQETRGYNFKTAEKRMDECPLIPCIGIIRKKIKLVPKFYFDEDFDEGFEEL